MEHLVRSCWHRLGGLNLPRGGRLLRVGCEVLEPCYTCFVLL